MTQLDHLRHKLKSLWTKHLKSHGVIYPTGKSRELALLCLFDHYKKPINQDQISDWFRAHSDTIRYDRQARHLAADGWYLISGNNRSTRMESSGELNRDQLMLLDINGGGSSYIGPLGTGIGNNGMAYDCSTDTLYGADASGDRIFTVDPATGLAGNFISTSVPFSSVGLEFDHATGLLLAATGSELWTVDPATGVSTFVGDLGGENIDDLAFYPQCP